MLFERTALSMKSEELIRKDLEAVREKRELTSALVFQDPYMLDFLELADSYSEKNLESVILCEIERFLIDLGAGFAFVERQKPITLDRTSSREVLEEHLHRASAAARNRLVLGAGVDVDVAAPKAVCQSAGRRGGRTDEPGASTRFR
jgi:hypothetical protein